MIFLFPCPVETNHGLQLTDYWWMSSELYSSIFMLRTSLLTVNHVVHLIWINDRENRRGKSRMDNPETQAMLGTRYRTQTHKAKSTTQNTEKVSNMYPNKNRS